jgi:hypothetical protein
VIKNTVGLPNNINLFDFTKENKINESIREFSKLFVDKLFIVPELIAGRLLIDIFAIVAFVINKLAALALLIYRLFIVPELIESIIPKQTAQKILSYIESDTEHQTIQNYLQTIKKPDSVSLKICQYIFQTGS